MQVIYNSGNLTKAASTTVDPNPVIAELKQSARRPNRFRAKPKTKPKAAAASTGSPFPDPNAPAGPLTHPVPKRRL
jgi:hypothetical protein